MNVPRTYISKIENGKAMPTLSSLDRLARALEVDISALLRDAPTRHSNETAVLMTDPFLAEIAHYTSQLDSLQRSIFLNHVRELAAGTPARPPDPCFSPLNLRAASVKGAALSRFPLPSHRPPVSITPLYA